MKKSFSQMEDDMESAVKIKKETLTSKGHGRGMKLEDKIVMLLSRIIKAVKRNEEKIYLRIEKSETRVV